MLIVPALLVSVVWAVWSLPWSAPPLRAPTPERPEVALHTLIEDAIGTQSVDCGAYFLTQAGRPAASASELRGAVACVTQHAVRKVPARAIAALAGIDSWVVQGLLAHRDGRVQYFIYDYLFGGGSPRALDPQPCAMPTVIDRGLVAVAPSVFTSHMNENSVEIVCKESPERPGHSSPTDQGQ